MEEFRGTKEQILKELIRIYEGSYETILKFSEFQDLRSWIEEVDVISEDKLLRGKFVERNFSKYEFVKAMCKAILNAPDCDIREDLEKIVFLYFDEGLAELINAFAKITEQELE